MADRFLINILNKCGIRVQWYEDKGQPTGYGYIYTLEGFTETPEQIEEHIAMDIALEYIIAQSSKLIENSKE